MASKCALHLVLFFAVQSLRAAANDATVKGARLHISRTWLATVRLLHPALSTEACAAQDTRSPDVVGRRGQRIRMEKRRKSRSGLSVFGGRSLVLGPHRCSVGGELFEPTKGRRRRKKKKGGGGRTAEAEGEEDSGGRGGATIQKYIQ